MTLTFEDVQKQYEQMMRDTAPAFEAATRQAPVTATAPYTPAPVATPHPEDALTHLTKQSPQTVYAPSVMPDGGGRGGANSGDTGNGNTQVEAKNAMDFFGNFASFVTSPMTFVPSLMLREAWRAYKEQQDENAKTSIDQTVRGSFDNLNDKDTDPNSPTGLALNNPDNISRDIQALNERSPPDPAPAGAAPDAPDGMNGPDANGGEASLKKGGFVKRQDFRSGGPVADPNANGKRDTVPAMLDDGEFVLTKKAVKNAGGGDVNKGAKKMYGLMARLEKKN